VVALGIEYLIPEALEVDRCERWTSNIKGFDQGSDRLTFTAAGIIPRWWIEHFLLGRHVHGAAQCGEIGSQFCLNIAAIECRIRGQNIGHERASIAEVRMVPGTVDKP
jgi:hypothetical protein